MLSVKLMARGLLLVSLYLAACEPQGINSSAGSNIGKESLIWPQPPSQPRIRFLQIVSKPEDLGIRPSFWKRVVEIVFGAEENWFIRPTGVAALGKTLYVADPGAQAFWILNPEAQRFTKIRSAGDQELISPVAVAPGTKGRVYLADSYLGKVFVYNAEGNLVQTITGTNFLRPTGVAYDPIRDRLYVADSGAHRVWIFSGDGKPAGLIGARGSANGEFNFPTHVAVDRTGNLYVTDALNFRLQIFAPEGSFSGKFGRHGDTSGDFAGPKGVGLDSAGHVYIADTLFDGVQIFDRQGRYLLTFGQNGLGPGHFWLPGGVFVGSDDHIYVADSYNQRIQIFEYLPGETND
jgi:DNA-binding beta-propeller fold protein YncE